MCNLTFDIDTVTMKIVKCWRYVLCTIFQYFMTEAHFFKEFAVLYNLFKTYYIYVYNIQIVFFSNTFVCLSFFLV